MDVDELRQAILERDPIHYDEGCGCCGSPGECGWCGGPRRYYSSAKYEPYGHWTDHEPGCVWLAAGGDPGPEPQPLPEDEQPEPKFVVPAPPAYVTDLFANMVGGAHPTLDLVRTPPPRTLADDVTSTVVTAIGEPQATAKIDVSDQMFGDVAEGDGLPGVFGWADAPPAMDDTRRALDELTRQMAEVTGRRLEELSALDDLEQLALRDGRDVIVFARDGKIEDAQITVRSDDPTVYLVDAAALDLRPVDGRTGPPGWLTGVRYLR